MHKRSRLDSETGFLSVPPQLTIISTKETRFLFLGKPGFLVIPRIQKPGFFLYSTVQVISTTETRFLFLRQKRFLSYPQDSETGFLFVPPQ
ncbi:hypothetical protein [Planktothricoides sp. SR001]|uniref:hypothetical protein n=1 Tax=Planktothricoides sp. SR001 TaxID=1705388 RepID=UPI0012E1094D|nr:hypothetical protein [Planktothricoides sp. SR001]